MNPKDLKDQELLSKTKSLVQKERELLTEVLQHMREIDRRKLYSDLGYRSLFDYAVKELGYSEGQAARRIQALRLMNEIPQVKAKIESGALSLTNISHAQSLFRESKKAANPMNSEQKLEVLAKLENKSTREAEKVLYSIGFETAIPREKERVISETDTEVRFVITEELKNKLQVVRALLGIKGVNMGWAELISEMASLSAERLEQKKFGKKRAEPEQEQTSRSRNKASEVIVSEHDHEQTRQNFTDTKNEVNLQQNPIATKQRVTRYISAEVKHRVWLRDKGRCQKCQSKYLLQYDHVKPIALNGETSEHNLRLRCFSCNQRAAMKTFGVNHMAKYQNLNSKHGCPEKIQKSLGV